jgi:hypothetical protein
LVSRESVAQLLAECASATSNSTYNFAFDGIGAVDEVPDVAKEKCLRSDEGEYILRQKARLGDYKKSGEINDFNLESRMQAMPILGVNTAN